MDDLAQIYYFFNPSFWKINKLINIKFKHNYVIYSNAELFYPILNVFYLYYGSCCIVYFPCNICDYIFPLKFSIIINIFFVNCVDNNNQKTKVKDCILYK